MIDRYYILNLRKKRERLLDSASMLVGAGVDVADISVWDAIDDCNFSSVVELCERASSDCNYFKFLLDSGMHTHCRIAYLCQFWGHIRFMKHVLFTDSKFVLIYDDQDLSCSSEDINKALSILPNFDRLHVAYLSCCRKNDDWNTLEFIDSTGWIKAHLFCLDGAIYYTPSGAKYLLDFFDSYQGYPYWGEYHHMVLHSLDALTDFYGVGLMINPAIGLDFKNNSNLHKVMDCSSFELAAVKNRDMSFDSSIHDVDNGLKPYRPSEVELNEIC